MNILYIYYWIKIAPNTQKIIDPKLFTGKTTNNWRLAEVFKEVEGVNVFIISDYIERYPAFESMGNVHIYRLSKFIFSRLGIMIRRLIQAPILAKKLIQKEKIDVIFLDFTTKFYGFYPILWVYKGFNKPTVLQFDYSYNYGVKNKKFRKLLVNNLLRSVSAIHVLIPYHKTEILDNVKLDSNKIHVIPNPVNELEMRHKDNGAAFRKKFGLGNSFIIAYIKGYVDLIEKFLSNFNTTFLKQINAKLVFIGDFPENLVKKYRSDQIIFTGPVSWEDMYQVYSVIDVAFFLEGSANDGSHTITRLAELAMAGVPSILAMKKSFIFTHLKDSYMLGVHFDEPEFYERLKAGIITLYNDRDLLKKIGIEARFTAVNTYSYEITAKKMYEMFDSTRKK